MTNVAGHVMYHVTFLLQSGTANPTVALYVVNVSTPQESRSLDPPSDIADA